MVKPIKRVRQSLTEESQKISDLAKDETVSPAKVRPFLRSRKEMEDYANMLKEVADSPTTSERRAKTEAEMAEEDAKRPGQIAEIQARIDTPQEREDDQRRLRTLQAIDGIRKDFPKNIAELDLDDESKEVARNVETQSKERQKSKGSFAATRDPEFLKSIDEAARNKPPDEISAKIQRAFKNRNTLDHIRIRDGARRVFDLSDLVASAITRLKEQLETLGCSKESFDCTFAIAKEFGRAGEERELRERTGREVPDEGGEIKDFDPSSGVEKYLQKALDEAEEDLANAAFRFRDMIVKRFEEDLDAALGIGDLRIPDLSEDTSFKDIVGEDENASLLPKKEDFVPMLVKVNGTECVTIFCPTNGAECEHIAFSNGKVIAAVAGKQVKKVIVVPREAINIIVE